MLDYPVTARRGFLARALAAVGGAALAGGRLAAAAQSPGDAWLQEVKGTHRCFFDCPQHMNGFGLVHILNYLATYAAVNKLGPGQVGAASSFYGLGSGSSIGMAFNDAMWAKYGLGEYFGLKDASGKLYIRNVFNAPTAADSHLLAQRVGGPGFALLGDAIQGASIPNLQKMGTTFLLCNNALQAWALDLESRGKGKAADIEKDLRANLLPGVTIVPAMVIAIEQAQAAGIRYNRQ